MEKRAIAYVADIVLGNTGEIIDRAFQKERIEKYAKDNDITIVRWFEDGAYEENPLYRPHMKEMIDCKEPCEYLLVERTWTISRRWSDLKDFIKLMEDKKIRIDAVTTLWDCVSQMARNYYRKPSTVPVCSLKVEPCEANSVNLGEEYGRSKQSRERATVKVSRETGTKRKVGRPNRLVFGELYYKSV